MSKQYKKLTAEELTVAILKALRKENDPIQPIIETVIEVQFRIREKQNKDE